MCLPLVAALACTLSTPSTVAPRLETALPATAPMSLPLEAGPASLLADWRSLPDDAPTDLELLPLTPAVVECDDDQRPAPPDCNAALASRWTADFVATCELPRASHARILVLRRGRVRTSGGVAAGELREMPPPLSSDPPTPPCPPARVLAPAPPSSSSLSWLALTAPPTPPSRRIDRPPRT
jgi:hypothetical protein